MSTPFTHDGPGTPAETWRDHPSWGRVPELGLANDGQTCTRLVVVAAHPDDESLGTGGLIAAAHDAGLAVYVVLLTAGEGSHPDSPTVSGTSWPSGGWPRRRRRWGCWRRTHRWSSSARATVGWPTWRTT